MSSRRPGHLKLLLFDIDGTLLLSGGAGLRALNQAFLELFGTANAFDGIPVAGRTDPLLLDDATTLAGIALDTAQRQRFHDRYCDLLELEIVRPGPRKGLMPGVEELLRYLHHQPELCVGLLTGNFARAAQIKLEYFWLWSFFVCGAYGDDAAERDELVPVAVGRARKIGAVVDSPAHVVVIGDTPLDIRCAAVAGARSVAVATGSFDVHTLERKGATAVLPDLSNQEAFLAILDEF
jgi:phosphoglycolate phosphatase